MEEQTVQGNVGSHEPVDQDVQGHDEFHSKKGPKSYGRGQEAVRESDEVNWSCLREDDPWTDPPPKETQVKTKKLLKTKKKEIARQQREPRRFSRRLAGLAAAVNVAQDLDSFLMSDEEDRQLD